MSSGLATRVKTRALLVILALAGGARGASAATAQGPAPTPRIVPLTRPVDCLAAAVYYEARGESPDGQAAVAQVVINRVNRPGFPRSLCAVIYQGAAAGRCQFSFACGDAMSAPRQTSAWRRAEVVAARALNGYVMRAVGQATAFHAVRLGHACDGRLTRLAQLGGHVFLGVGKPITAQPAALDVKASAPVALDAGAASSRASAAS